jgi:glycosyltransferase involved in cell wall biosynthesis
MNHHQRLKIIFLTEPLNSPSTRFRVLQFKSELEKLNLDITVSPIPKKIFSRLKLLNSLPNFDITVLQRKLFQPWILSYLKVKSKVLFFDFDDAITFRDSNAIDFYSKSRQSRFKYTAKRANRIITGNEYLKELAQPFNKNVTVIPTGINTQLYTPKAPQESNLPLTIGWIGSQPNLGYLKTLIEPINKLYSTNKNFRLKIVCDGFIDGFQCPTEKKIWRENDEIADIQSFDIGISPLTEDKWTKGKCALKLLQYMSCGLSSVSSATAVTSKIIQDGHNGFLASSPNDWLEKLKFLLNNQAQSKTMGLMARMSLDGTFDEKTIAKKYATLFRQENFFKS